jgi:hypothetical protein
MKRTRQQKIFRANAAISYNPEEFSKELTVFVEAYTVDDATIKVLKALLNSFDLKSDDVEIYNVYSEYVLVERGKAASSQVRLLEGGYTSCDGRVTISSLVANPLFLIFDDFLESVYKKLCAIEPNEILTRAGEIPPLIPAIVKHATEDMKDYISDCYNAYGWSAARSISEYINSDIATAKDKRAEKLIHLDLGFLEETTKEKLAQVAVFSKGQQGAMTPEAKINNKYYVYNHEALREFEDRYAFDYL